MYQQQKTVTESVFGRKIDEKCAGYSWWAKLLVLTGVMANEVDSRYYDKVDVELDRKEESNRRRRKEA